MQTVDKMRDVTMLKKIPKTVSGRLLRPMKYEIIRPLTWKNHDTQHRNKTKRKTLGHHGDRTNAQ